VNKATWGLSVIRRLIIVIAIAIVFVFGLATTVFLSLRSPEVQVPDVVGKDRSEAERVLGDAGLNVRVRAYRPGQMKADTVLFQLPKGGEVVKVGQTVAMDISRPVKEGESSDVVAPEKSPEEKPANGNEASLANDNKPKRPKNTNKNANENANGNANTANRNANTNRATINRNSNNGNTNGGVNSNSNRPATNGNANRAVNQNGNTRPVAPRPSPTARPN
jgi:beta-lactam-binding protein with PASTA domain